MRLLHSSDWHLGRALYQRTRYQEFEAFLDWLKACIEREQIDVLLIAGDIFDTTTPSHRAQALYYRFLHDMTNTTCRHVVIIAGNHDSPSLLNAPRELLRQLNVHVIGDVSQQPADEVLCLNNSDGVPELLVCAVPYLRDRAIRKAEAGESPVDKERKLLDGIRKHYQSVIETAEGIREQLDQPVPLIALGHLFTAGGQIVAGDGVRDLYVGSLAHVGAEIFPPSIDYLALGHLHVAQKVAGKDHFRYSGSPIPMGFGEAGQQKVVLRVDFANGKPDIQELVIPCWQALIRLSGDWETLQKRLHSLQAENSQAWLEITYDGEPRDDLRAQLDELIKGTELEILRIKNARQTMPIWSSSQTAEALEQLDTLTVFQRCLEAHAVPPLDRPQLESAYQELLIELQQADRQAE
jgi:exonuclease SbcD